MPSSCKAHGFLAGRTEHNPPVAMELRECLFRIFVKQSWLHIYLATIDFFRLQIKVFYSRQQNILTLNYTNNKNIVIFIPVINDALFKNKAYMVHL